MMAHPLHSAWWRWQTNLRHAWRALLAAPRRFVFSCASLSIGIGAMIAVLGIGQSLHAHAVKQFESSGLQVARLTVNGNKRSNGEPLRDALKMDLLKRAIRASAEAPATASASQPGGADAVSIFEVHKLDTCVSDAAYAAELVGFRGDFARHVGSRLVAGRLVSELDGDANWALLGYDLAQDITRAKGFLPLGQSVLVCGVVLRVAGVLQKGQEGAYILPFNLNHSALITAPALTRLASGGSMADVLLHFANRDEVEPRAERIRQAYQSAAGVETQLATPGQMLAAMREQEAALISSLLVTGLVVLVIGAFGIMENLLSSINERRAEIGIRLSVGAAPLDIRQQFALEAMLLVTAGGVIGLLLGLLAAFGYAQLRQVPFIVSFDAVWAALGLIAIIGFCSGFFPARRAAGLDPIVAIST